ncbi:MAG TPA: HEPN domain-containing protein [Lacipirellulaceae bacterium]|nr:HEPN domain-containing protein [Lacipirellulaceae bacterium]HMP08206.1 HEPN domain-containing protein [Lacipirellulaceae bacterium]
MMHPSLFGTEFFTDEIFGFHAQQAAEKALKAWLSFRGLTYSRTHDLLHLIRELEEAGEQIEDQPELLELNPFAVQYRYETMDEPDVSPIDRTAVVKKISALIDHVAQFIDA